MDAFAFLSFRQVVWEEEVAPETLDTLLDEDDLR